MSLLSLMILSRPSFDPLSFHEALHHQLSRGIRHEEVAGVGRLGRRGGGRRRNTTPPEGSYYTYLPCKYAKEEGDRETEGRGSVWISECQQSSGRRATNPRSKHSLDSSSELLQYLREASSYRVLGSMSSDQKSPEQCRIHQTELNKRSIEQIPIQQFDNLTYVSLNKNHIDQLQIYQIVN